MSKEIPLTQGQVAIVDDGDYEYLNQWKWFARWSPKGRCFYARRNLPIENGKRTGVDMHRVIMQTPEGMDCDHINHNTLDNRRENLRNVTTSQNIWNSIANRNTRLHLKNIDVDRGSYRVRVAKNGKVVYYHIFKTLDEALRARDEAIKTYHGEYACYD